MSLRVRIQGYYEQYLCVCRVFIFKVSRKYGAAYFSSTQQQKSVFEQQPGEFVATALGDRKNIAVGQASSGMPVCVCGGVAWRVAMCSLADLRRRSLPPLFLCRWDAIRARLVRFQERREGGRWEERGKGEGGRREGREKGGREKGGRREGEGREEMTPG